MLGCTRGIPGGGFLYTNADTVAVGVVLGLPAAGRRQGPAGGDHRRPQGPSVDRALPAGRNARGVLRAPDPRGRLRRDARAGRGRAARRRRRGGHDAGRRDLAGGRQLRHRFRRWRPAARPRRAIGAGDVSAAGLASYRKDLEGSFVLADHKRLRKAPHAAAVRAGPAALSGTDGRPGGGDVHRDQPDAQARCREAGAAGGQAQRPDAGASSPRTPWRSGGCSDEPCTRNGRRNAGRTMSFEERMATVEFRVGERAHIVVDSDVCRSCTTKACVHACPANLFAPDRGRRDPVQLRAVLRVRHLLHGLQRRGRDQLDLPGRRPGRRLPARLNG